MHFNLQHARSSKSRALAVMSSIDQVCMQNLTEQSDTDLSNIPSESWHASEVMVSQPIITITVGIKIAIIVYLLKINEPRRRYMNTTRSYALYFNF